MASSQVLKCHFWGSASFPGRVQPSGETSSSFPHPRWCWWAFASSHPPQRGPGFFDTALAFSPSKLRALEPPLTQGRPGQSCRGSATSPDGAGLRWEGESPTRNSCLWPVALLSVCFKKLRWLLVPRGLVLLGFRVLDRTR